MGLGTPEQISKGEKSVGYKKELKKKANRKRRRVKMDEKPDRKYRGYSM